MFSRSYYVSWYNYVEEAIVAWIWSLVVQFCIEPEFWVGCILPPIQNVLSQAFVYLETRQFMWEWTNHGNISSCIDVIFMHTITPNYVNVQICMLIHFTVFLYELCARVRLPLLYVFLGVWRSFVYILSIYVSYVFMGWVPFFLFMIHKENNKKWGYAFLSPTIFNMVTHN